jgi:hypothetical protein
VSEDAIVGSEMPVSALESKAALASWSAEEPAWPEAAPLSAERLPRLLVVLKSVKALKPAWPVLPKVQREQRLLTSDSQQGEQTPGARV